MNRMIERSKSTLTNESGFGLVEVLIATIVLAFGLLAVAGLSLSTAGQERIARWQTDQAMAAQLALAQAFQADFDSVASGSSDIEVGGHRYRVKMTVTDITSRVKQVDAAIAGVGPLDSRTFSTRLYAPRPLLGPVVLDGDSGGSGGSDGGDGGDTGGDTGSTGDTGGDTGSTGGDTGGDTGGSTGDTGDSGSTGDALCILPGGKLKKNCP